MITSLQDDNAQYAENRIFLLGISKMQVAYLSEISALATLSLFKK